MRARKKLKRNLAAERLADALQEIADSEREKIFVRLQKALDSARKKVLGAPPKGSRKSRVTRNGRRKSPRRETSTLHS
jgi:hypothetical protein